jgi:two-component system chemotaxis response regulator CheB
MIQPIRLIIVDDSSFIRSMLKKILEKESDIEIVAEAADPYEAREKIKRFNPDVITLDIEMPHMDGLAFLEKIMNLRPMPVIMLSTLTTRNAAKTLAALELGAFDVVAKPDNPAGLVAIREELCRKIRAAHTVRASLSGPRTLETGQPSGNITRNTAVSLIAFGASTGGVEALSTLLVSMYPPMPPMLITQHMPAGFLEPFANRLDGKVAFSVLTAEEHTCLQENTVYIAPGGDVHLGIVRSREGFCIHLIAGEKRSGHRPSVDVMMESVAQQCAGGAIGVLLTGMGKDGAEGLLAMRNAGAHTIAQNRHSSLVYGMPKQAVSLNAAVEELSLACIARRLQELSQNIHMS